MGWWEKLGITSTLRFAVESEQITRLYPKGYRELETRVSNHGLTGRWMSVFPNLIMSFNENRCRKEQDKIKGYGI